MCISIISFSTNHVCGAPAMLDCGYSTPIFLKQSDKKVYYLCPTFSEPSWNIEMIITQALIFLDYSV